MTCVINFSAIRVSREKFNDARFVADYASINDVRRVVVLRAARCRNAARKCHERGTRKRDGKTVSLERCLLLFFFYLLQNDARYREPLWLCASNKNVENPIYETPTDLRLLLYVITDNTLCSKKIEKNLEIQEETLQQKTC